MTTRSEALEPDPSALVAMSETLAPHVLGAARLCLPAQAEEDLNAMADTAVRLAYAAGVRLAPAVTVEHAQYAVPVDVTPGARGAAMLVDPVGRVLAMSEPTGLTPERMAEIRQGLAGSNPHYDNNAARAARELLVEVERLRKAAECVMTHTEPFDFAECSTHDTTFPLGGTCKFDGRDPFEVIYEEADDQRARAVMAEMRLDRAEAEVARLRAELAEFRPVGRAWDVRDDGDLSSPAELFVRDPQPDPTEERAGLIPHPYVPAPTLDPTLDECQYVTAFDHICGAPRSEHDPDA